MGSTAGKVVLVFGASSGIGLEAARTFAADGASVVLAARRETLVREEAERLTARGGAAMGLRADVGDRAEVDAVVEATRDRFGRVDVLVNAAGVNIPNRRLTQLGDGDWQMILQNNLTGAYNTLQAVLPTMRDQNDGLIIQIASVSARYGDYSGAAYQASKHGVMGLCYATMAEEHMHGIRATALMPGLVDTPLLNYRPTPPAPETLAQALQPEDIAAACLFVAQLPARAYVPEMLVLPGALQWIGRTAS